MNTLKILKNTVVAIAIISCTVACDKQTTTSNNFEPSTKSNPNGTMIGYYESGANDFTLTFDRNAFEAQFNPYVDSLLGHDYVYEYISIVDDDIWGFSDYPAISISLFNIAQGSSYTVFWFDIDKTIEGNVAKYYLRSNTTNTRGISDWTFVTCKGTNCPDGCKKNGKECTPCNKAQNSSVVPSCERLEEPAMKTVLPIVGTIIVALIALL
ncbi:MAG: hypothetical protein IJ789_06535 [Bacteroidales bacterium]|nr:hypothetical protein [Bacteroidales bacterium]